MKTQQYRSKLQQELNENYNICTMLQKQSATALKYEQILYVISNGRIPMPKIAYFRKKMYKYQQPSLQKQAVIQDAIKLKNQVINKAWRFQKADDVDRANKKTFSRKQFKPLIKANDTDDQNKTIQNQQQKQTVENQPKKQTDGLKNRRSQTTKQKQSRQIKERKQNLEQQMIILQSKLNLSSRNEDEAAEYQKEYNKCLKELNYLRNKKRVEKEENLLKKIASQTSETVPEKITNLLTEMNEIKNKNAKILHKQPSYQQKLPKTEEISRINMIFSHYSKKQIKASRYFSDLQKDQNKLLLQTFIQFAHDWGLDRIISFEQIVALFKARSKGNRFVDNLKFSEILADIHNSECIKEERPINNESISHYMQEYIVCDEKINKYILNSDKNVKRQESADYKFKLKSLSGKYLHDITQQLQSRKKTVDFLAGPRNNQVFQNRKARSRNYTLQNSRADEAETISRPGLDTINNPSNISLNDSVNSYAFRFKLKNTKSRIKTEGIIKSIQNNQSSIKNQDLIKALEANRENINIRNQSRYQTSQTQKKIQEAEQARILEEAEEDKFIEKAMSKNKKKPVPFEGFEDLIEQSSEDQYLNKHLFPPIEQKRLARHIHY